jgi:hypothetical protein
MTITKRDPRPRPWEAKWAFIPSMNQHHDDRAHLCVAVKVEGDTVTVLPTSTKPVNGRPNQRPIRWGGTQVYPATNRVFTIPLWEWASFCPADAHHQPDREVRGYLKQELCRA